MTLSVWDTMAIAGFIVLWLMIFLIILSIFASLAKRSRQKKQKEELYEKVMDAIKTDKDFERIVRDLQKGTDNE